MEYLNELYCILKNDDSLLDLGNLMSDPHLQMILLGEGRKFA